MHELVFMLSQTFTVCGTGLVIADGDAVYRLERGLILYRAALLFQHFQLPFANTHKILPKQGPGTLARPG